MHATYCRIHAHCVLRSQRLIDSSSTLLRRDLLGSSSTRTEGLTFKASEINLIIVILLSLLILINLQFLKYKFFNNLFYN